MIPVDPGACWAACAALALMSLKPATVKAALARACDAPPLDCATLLDCAPTLDCAMRLRCVAALGSWVPASLVGVRPHEVMTVRPAVPADGAALHALYAALTPADLGSLGGAPPLDNLARGAGCGNVRAVSLVAQRGDGPASQLIGLVRLYADRDGIAGEFAILVHPSARCRGLGRLLLERLLSECRRRRLLLVRASALPRNAAMLALARRCGFQRLPAADGTVELALVLAPRPAPVRADFDRAGRR
jgi:GNAT superfamily N-acetyltransferase